MKVGDQMIRVTEAGGDEIWLPAIVTSSAGMISVGKSRRDCTRG